MKCPAFEWNLEHFSGNFSDKDALIENNLRNIRETFVFNAVIIRKIMTLYRHETREILRELRNLAGDVQNCDVSFRVPLNFK